MNEVVKLGLIGAGIYLLISNTKIGAPAAPGASPSPAGAVVPPPPGAATASPAPPPAPAPAPAPAPNQPTVATAPAPATPNEAIARLAAAGNPQAIQQADTLGLMYNADQWNWLRAAGGGGYTTTDLFPPDNRAALMGIRDYLARRTAAGLSGMRGGWRR